MIDLDHISDDELWDMLIADSHAIALDGHRVDIIRYLEGVPSIRGRPGALQAAIAATIENAVTLGDEREATADRLRQEHPWLADEIDCVELVAGLVEGVGASDSDAPREVRVLPCPFGLPWKDGEPRYQLHELLARGTRGTVYRGKDRALSNPNKPADIAVKVIPSWSGMVFSDVRAEAIRAKQIDHPNVARVLDVGDNAPGECFIVFEFVDGVTLEHHIDSLPSRPGRRESVELLLPALEGLAVAHDNGLAHLDLHPRNILIDRAGQPSLIDFGLGVAAYEAWRPAERPLGSLGFMAPETYARAADASPLRCDVYCAAGLLFWCIAGVIPNGQSIEEIEARILDHDARLPGEDAARFIDGPDDDLAAIISRGLSRDPNARYATARAFATDLRAWLDHRPIDWRRPGPVRQARLLARRSPLAAFAFGLALVALILGSVGVTSQYVSHENAMRLEAAERRAAETELAQQAAEADAKLARGMRDLSTAFSGFLRSREGTSAGRGWVVMLTLAHGLIERGLRLDESVLAATHEKRIEAARRFLEDAERELGPDSLEARLWHGALATWLFDSGDYSAARVQLARCHDRWDDLLPQGDPILLRLQLYTMTSIALDPATPNDERQVAATDALSHPFVRDLAAGVRVRLKEPR